MHQIEARIASPEADQAEGRAQQDGRTRHRPRRRLAVTRWWQRRAVPGFDLGGLAMAVAAPERSPSVRLAHVLDEAAHRVAERGTVSERRLLDAMAEVAAPSAPGAAAALVDPDGTEVSRLRAYGLVHSILLATLGPRDHARLLDVIDRKDDLERSCRVA